MWRLILYFEDDTVVIRTYKTRRGAAQAGHYWWRHRSDLKEYEYARVD